MALIHRFFTPPEASYFLFGPRGTGKSVLTQSLYPEAFRLDLLEPDVHREYAARPERLRERLAAEPKVPQVVVDEVQRVCCAPMPRSTIGRKCKWKGWSGTSAPSRASSKW